jgi:hypothetical protein
MKTFGLVVPKGKGRIFEANVRRLLDGEHALSFFPLRRRFEMTKAINSRFCSVFERSKMSAAY